MKPQNILELVIIVLFVCSLIAIAIPAVTHMAAYYDRTDTFYKPGSVPFNLSLRETPCPSLISITNGSAVAVPVKNYTSYLPDVCKVQISDTRLIKGATVDVTYYYGYELSGFYLVLALLIGLFLVAGTVVVMWNHFVSGDR